MVKVSLAAATCFLLFVANNKVNAQDKRWCYVSQGLGSRTGEPVECPEKQPCYTATIRYTSKEDELKANRGITAFFTGCWSGDDANVKSFLKMGDTFDNLYKTVAAPADRDTLKATLATNIKVSEPAFDATKLDTDFLQKNADLNKNLFANSDEVKTNKDPWLQTLNKCNFNRLKSRASGTNQDLALAAKDGKPLFNEARIWFCLPVNGGKTRNQPINCNYQSCSTGTRT